MLVFQVVAKVFLLTAKLLKWPYSDCSASFNFEVFFDRFHMEIL